MFTKKLEDQFSADLLNTVKGILGEAKHDKECECEKCEKEEDDDEDEDEKENGKEDKKKEMKEGYVSAAQRKAVWANRADDGKGHPDKKKKMKKEGYVPTADEPAEHDKKVAQKVRDLLAKEKKPMKEEKRGLWANIHAKRKRIKAGSGERMRKPGSEGAPTDANFKAASESVEIEEAENKTGLPKSTAEKNKQHIEITSLLGHKRRVPVHPTNAYKALNRYRNDPSTKSARIVSEEIELEEGKMKDLVTKHMDAGHDYETALKKAKRDLDVPFEGPYKKPGVRKDQYGNVVKNVAKHLAKKAMAKEEVEQIDEIGDTPAGKRALGRYIKDRRGTILGAGMGMEKQNKDRSTTDKQRKDLGRKASNAFTGVARAVDRLTKEEQEFIDALNNDTLEEGRGRPPKEGSAAWHAKQQKDNDDMPALGVQLRKAKSMNKKVRFMDGKEHEIHPNHADRFEDHMAARKSSQEKAAFQKQAHKSHADFVKAVSAPVPKASKDTGEIVKYRH